MINFMRIMYWVKIAHPLRLNTPADKLIRYKVYCKMSQHDNFNNTTKKL